MPPYIPIRLRCLPFSLGPRTSDASPADRLLIRRDLGLTAAGGERIFADDGTLSRAAATILKALLRLEQGQRKLAAAAELLLLTGILAPLGDAAPECSHGMLYGVESSAFSRMTPLQCAVAGKSDFLPLELAVAMLFSERHLLHRMRPESHVPAAAAKVPQELDLVVQGIEPYPLQLDTSELFRIDELSAEADAGRQGQE